MPRIQRGGAPRDDGFRTRLYGEPRRAPMRKVLRWQRLITRTTRWGWGVLGRPEERAGYAVQDSRKLQGRKNRVQWA